MTPSLNLEQHSHAELRLTRVAVTALDGPVEIEDEVGHLRPLDVAAVGQIENLEDGLHGGPAHPEVPRDAQIPAEELVVLAERVALDDRAIRLNAVLRRVADRLGLSRSGGHPIVHFEF